MRRLIAEAASADGTTSEARRVRKFGGSYVEVVHIRTCPTCDGEGRVEVIGERPWESRMVRCECHAGETKEEDCCCGACLWLQVVAGITPRADLTAPERVVLDAYESSPCERAVMPVPVPQRAHVVDDRGNEP